MQLIPYYQVHHGFVVSAIAIKRKLDDEYILPKLFAKYPRINLF